MSYLGMTIIMGMAVLFSYIAGIYNINQMLMVVIAVVLGAGIYNLLEYLKKNMQANKRRKRGKSKILDTSVLIDGRILDILGTGFVEGDIIIPGFVLKELQALSDSSDNLKRARGRRGLDLVKELQDNKRLEIIILNKEINKPDVDSKLIELAKHMDADILTMDFNLNKVATIQGVKVLNINELSNSLKVVVLPNELLTIELIKKGDRDGQAVGYLEDGTMVVAEDGKDSVGKTVKLLVTSVFPTAAGRMIFGRIYKK